MTTDPDSPTPALDLMAELSGRRREELTTDPRALAVGLAALGDAFAVLVRDLNSPDEGVRAAAEVRRQVLLARATPGPPLVDVLRDRVSAALDEALRQLRR